MLSFDLATGSLCEDGGMVFADRPYRYLVRCAGMEAPAPLVEVQIEREDGADTLRGRFAGTALALRQTLRWLPGGGLAEELVLTNRGETPLTLEQIELGFCASLAARPDWSLCAVPFRVQLDGSRHDYSVQALARAAFHNSIFVDPTREYMPPLAEDGLLRSEAWAWGGVERGVLVLKYNPVEIELSVARPFEEAGERLLQFGGAGFSLYGEPSAAGCLAPGATFLFGTTTYLPYSAGQTEAFRRYREFLDARGHAIPADYDPPLNWNELYDIGWFHSNPADLAQHYTRAALLREAAKAKEIGCDLLYLDPGWEVCEGSTLWDESRLGSPASLVETLRVEYGLGLGYRSVLRSYCADQWPAELLIEHEDGTSPRVTQGELTFREPCLCSTAFFAEKLRRTLAISRQGVRFMMIDEYDWRGPCHNPAHGHPVPTTALDHVRAVYRLCSAIRAACPEMLIECHDPVWPWATSIYVPTYFGQGFGAGSYQENWGFEYMWDCLNDLRSGRALALYYYNLGCSIPLYLHITMAADNDACLFFWWCASTVRHLGIGGRDSHSSIEPPGGLPEWDKEKRFAAYTEQVQIYRALKPYFTRGVFSGISETAHLHTLSGAPGGVLALFNLGDAEEVKECFIAHEALNASGPLAVEGAQAEWSADGVTLRRKLAGMTPALVRIGAAVG